MYHFRMTTTMRDYIILKLKHKIANCSQGRSFSVLKILPPPPLMIMLLWYTVMIKKYTVVILDKDMNLIRSFGQS